LTQNFHEQTKQLNLLPFLIMIFLNKSINPKRNLLLPSLFFFLTFCCSNSLIAQTPNSCPCENCPGLIEDNTGFRAYRLNVFNVKNNDLSSPAQCVSKVGLNFKHEYVGDLDIKLISSGGDTVQLLGDVTFSAGTNGQTDNRIFDIAFVGNGEPAVPDNGYENKWNNDQEWQGIGTLDGTYLPFKGDLADFDEGRVNGTWTLIVGDFANDRRDEGELFDFYVEFCDPTGLVCNPCLDPEDTPDCIFRVDAGETTVVPDEVFCLPIYAENVAFLRNLRFPLKWDPTILEYVGVDSFEIEFLEQSDFNIMDVGNGNLAFSYTHTFDDLGLVVADSTPIFQVCFKALGSVGDSSLVTVSFPPSAINVDGETLLEETIEGTVKITVDSTADCIRAIQLCGKETVSVAKSRGPGFEKNEAIATCSPDGLERQAKWYQFDVLESGELAFLIKPKGASSYGFSLYKNACPNAGDSEAINCLVGTEEEGMGLSNNAFIDFEETDVSGTNFLPALNVAVGETYFLLIDNFSANGVGFDLSFAGTAVIGDETLRAKIADPGILNCTNPTIQLDATNSTMGNQYNPEWTTDEGSIDFLTNFFQPTINKGGQFNLTITDPVTGCVATDSVFVATDMVIPEAVANNGGVIDCNGPTRMLTTLGSSAGDKYAILWTNTTMEIPDLPATETLTVDKGGAYELKITNTENGCTATDSVLVTEDFVAPQLTAADNLISCTQPIADLLATSTTLQVEYEWSGGNLMNPLPDAAISVNDTGIFIIKVTSEINGCFTKDSVRVREERIYPIAEAGEPLVLNCTNPTLQIAGNTSSQGLAFTYGWITPDGQFLSDTDINSLTPEVSAGGIYILSVKNTDNGCESLDTVQVDTSFTPPKISITADTLLTCFEPILTLDAAASDSGSIYAFDWFASDGNLIQDAATYQPKVTEAGSYILNIRNTENGCASAQIIDIAADQIFPIADAGISQTLNCSNPVVIVDGNLSSTGMEFEYNWTTEDGHFIGETDGVTANVDSAGVYQLSVSNTENGCSTDTTVIILKDFDIPDLAIPRDSTLTCQIPSITLTASSLTPNTNFSWRLPDNTTIPLNQLAATNGGVYIATVIAANGCAFSDSLRLDVQQVLPNILLENPATITCVVEEVTIMGDQSEQGANFEFIWTTEEGVFTDETQASNINPLVKESGKYFLEITNTTTGCIAKDSIVVPSSVVNPIVNFVNEPSIFSCKNPVVEVSATSDVSDAIYQWKLATEIISDTAELAATAPGVYSVIVVNPANSCSSLMSLEIEADTIRPLADAGPTKELNCTIGAVELDAGGSVQGEEFSYLWKDFANNDLSSELKIEVSSPGVYNLIVVDQSNGCRSIDSVRVTVSRDNPIADAGKDTIYCSGVEADILAFSLGGNATSIGANFVYEWFDNTPISLGDSIKQEVNLAGQYFLEVTNTENNCVSKDSVSVFERPRPVVSFTSTGGINCAGNEIRYLAESDIPSSVIKWFGRAEIDSALLVVTDALLEEEFIAFAEDTITGCRGSSTTVRVTADRSPPMLTAGEDTKVNCADTLRLAGQLLSVDIEVAVNWQTDEGNIVTSAAELNPIVDAAGEYILTIENTTNFCQATDTVIVTTDQVLPTLEVGIDQILTCFNPELTITPTEISEGANFYYSWRDTDKKIISREKEVLIEFPGAYQLMVIDSSNLCSKFDSLIIIDSLNPPEIEIIIPDLITCLNNQTELNTNINIADATYQWSIFSEEGNILGETNQPNLLVDSAGIYQVEVTNNFSGCTGEKNIMVEDIRRKIEIEAGADKTITCNKDTTVLAAGTIFSMLDNLRFEWTSDASNFTKIDSTLIFTINESGTYFLSVVDTLSACEALDSFIVDKDISPIDFNIGVADTLNCARETVILGDINVVGLPYLYQWTTEHGNITAGADQPAVMVNQPGRYQLLIESTVNGCTFSDSLNVVVDRLRPTIDIGLPQELTCLKKEAVLGGENTAVGTNFIYEWTTQNGVILSGEDTPLATINAAGTYQLLIRNTNNQCEETASVSVTTDQESPIIELPQNLSFACTDDFIAIEPTTEEILTNLSTLWRTDNGVFADSNDNFLTTVAAPGMYFIMVEDRTNNCVTTDSVLVADNRELPEIKSLDDQTLGCDDRTLILDATGSETGDLIVYKWTDEMGRTLSNNTLLTTAEAGSYILEITNQANSCVSRDTVQVNENENPPIGAEFTIVDPACEGLNNGFIEVGNVRGGTTPFNYVLNNFDTNQIALFSDLAPNMYTLTIVDELACAWDTTILLNQPAPLEVTIVSNNEELVTGQIGSFNLLTSIPTTDIAEILWTPSDLINCNDCEEIETSFTTSTTLNVEVMDINGCIGNTSLEVVVDLAAVPNAITPNGDGKNDFFKIPMIEEAPDAFPNSELTIFNRWGDIVFQTTPYNNDWDGQNNTGNPIPEGTYYYVLRLDTKEGEIIKGDVTILRN